MTIQPLTNDLAARAIIAATKHYGMDITKVMAATGKNSNRRPYPLAAKALAIATDRRLGQIERLLGSNQGASSAAAKRDPEGFAFGLQRVLTAIVPGGVGDEPARPAPKSVVMVRPAPASRAHQIPPMKPLPAAPMNRAEVRTPPPFSPDQLGARRSARPEAEPIPTYRPDPEMAPADDASLVRACVAAGGFSRVEGGKWLGADGQPLKERRA